MESENCELTKVLYLFVVARFRTDGRKLVWWFMYVAAKKEGQYLDCVRGEGSLHTSLLPAMGGFGGADQLTRFILFVLLWSQRVG